MKKISDELNVSLNNLVGKCFAINRMLDRGMSLLKVRWKMPITSDILHPKVAHAFTGDLFADGISDYQASRDMETVYPATPMGDKDYDAPIDFFVDFLNECMDFQSMLYDAYEQADEDSDYTTKNFISKIIDNLSEFTDIAQLMIDLCESYGTDKLHMAMLDGVIDEYFD